jgi:hypothetical protein
MTIQNRRANIVVTPKENMMLEKDNANISIANISIQDKYIQDKPKIGTKQTALTLSQRSVKIR